MGKNKMTDDQVAEHLKNKIKGSKVVVEAVEVSKKMQEDMPGFGKKFLRAIGDTFMRLFTVIFWKVPIGIFVAPWYNAFRSK